MAKNKKVVIVAHKSLDDGEMKARVAGGNPNMNGYVCPSIYDAKDCIRSSRRNSSRVPKEMRTIHEVELISEKDWRSQEVFKALVILETASDENIGAIKLIEKAFIAGYNLRKEQESKK